MQKLPNLSGQERLGAVDSLRGLAAFAVLLGHALAVCDWPSGYTRWPLTHLLFDGRSAVTMFFVLSGFVLTFAHLNHTSKPFLVLPFYLRRFTRVWLPWFAFFLLSLLAKHGLQSPWPNGQLRQGAWLSGMWQGATTLQDVLRQMVFQLHDAHRMLLSQDWSLGVELRASLLIPILLFLARWRWWVLAIVGIGFSYFAHNTGYYFTSFVAGVLAAHWNARTDHFRHGALIFITGLVLYHARWLSEVAAPQTFFKERDVWVLSTVGCTLIFAGGLRCARIRNFLEHRVFLYLGRVSYSLYLVQMIVLICFTPWIVLCLNQLGIQSIVWNQLLLLIVVSGVCLLLAELGVRLIEFPCIRLGNVLTRWLARKAWVQRISF